MKQCMRIIIPHSERREREADIRARGLKYESRGARLPDLDPAHIALFLLGQERLLRWPRSYHGG